jgi:hypothetical protein
MGKLQAPSCKILVFTTVLSAYSQHTVTLDIHGSGRLTCIPGQQYHTVQFMQSNTNTTCFREVEVGYGPGDGPEVGPEVGPGVGPWPKISQFSRCNVSCNNTIHPHDGWNLSDINFQPDEPQNNNSNNSNSFCPTPTGSSPVSRFSTKVMLYPYGVQGSRAQGRLPLTRHSGTLVSNSGQGQGLVIRDHGLLAAGAGLIRRQGLAASNSG